MIWRNYTGFGDWVMAMTVIRMINCQHPEVAVCVNTRASGRALPPLLMELLAGFDVRIAEYVAHRFPGFQGRYDFRSGHLIYDLRSSSHLIAGMAERFGRATGIPLRYDPGELAQWRGPVPSLGIPEPYVLMPSCGKPEIRSLKGKNWKPEYFNTLCAMLTDSGLTVVQIGAAEDPPLEAAAARFLGRSLNEVCALLRNCSFLVGLVNGLAHLAGHLGVKAYILYCGGRESPEKTCYPGQVPLVRLIAPGRVADAILAAEAR